MFKVGDKVVLIEQYGNNQAGDAGVVLGVRPAWGSPVTQMVSVKFDDGRRNTMFNTRLVRVSEPLSFPKPSWMPLSFTQGQGPMRAVVNTVDRIFPRRSYDTILKSLMEEVGELATEIAIEQGTKDRVPSADGIKGEAVDVFVVAMDMLRQAWGDDLFSAEFDAKVAEKLAKWEGK